MRIVQLVPTLAYGDAIGNDTLAIHKALKNWGYETVIYAENILPPLKCDRTIRKAGNLEEIRETDIVLYHFSTGTSMNRAFGDLPAVKVMIYHNVTPPSFFKGYDSRIEKINTWALQGLEYLRDRVDYCIADSDYNREDLINAGYQCPVYVIPVLIPFEDYRAVPDPKVIAAYSGKGTNIVFTGRVAPNKRQENVIDVFRYYKKYCDTEAKLFLVGAYQEKELYYQRLKMFREYSDTEDIYFTGHVSFHTILAYYHIADAFLCMSDHEGFCVPLVEAMFFKVPVFAKETTAIPYTLGGGGILLKNYSSLETALLIHRVLSDHSLKKRVIDAQNKRIKEFSYDRVTGQLREVLKQILGKEGL